MFEKGVKQRHTNIMLSMINNCQNNNQEKKEFYQVAMNNMASDFESRQNLADFFSLLLRVDKKINPQNYKQQKEKQND